MQRHQKQFVGSVRVVGGYQIIINKHLKVLIFCDNIYVTVSKIGKKPIAIPDGVEVQLKDGFLHFKGKEGNLELKSLPYIKVEIKDKQIQFTATADHKQARANWGTIASLTKNAIAGVKDGFSKKLQLEGIGYRASLEGNKNLVLTVGFSHPVKFEIPATVKVAVEKSIITISGFDKAAVGEVAAQIRRIKKPEPYQGKGIRYVGEVVRRKAGKKAATAATAS